MVTESALVINICSTRFTQSNIVRYWLENFAHEQSLTTLDIVAPDTPITVKWRLLYLQVPNRLHQAQSGLVAPSTHTDDCVANLKETIFSNHGSRVCRSCKLSSRQSIAMLINYCHGCNDWSVNNLLLYCRQAPNNITNPRQRRETISI